MFDMNDHQEKSKHGLKSPLIPSHQYCRNGEEEEEEEGQWAEVRTELVKQVKLAGPLIAVSLMQFSLQLISVMFIGHLGELSLASSSMATSFAGVTGFSFMLGMGSALETFCGQAYGARQYYMLGIHMQRAMFVLLLICIPISITWFFTASIFTFFGQDPEISAHAGVYARFLIPCLFPYGLLQCQMRFMQAQNNVKALMVITTITSCFHVFACWVLVIGLGLGSRGAALAIAVSYWVNVVVLGGYIKLSGDCDKTWTGFSKEGLEGLGGFLALAVPSAFMVCLEFWSYEVLVLMSGLLPNPKLETSMMSVSLSTSSLIFRIPYGLGSVYIFADGGIYAYESWQITLTHTRVSNELGAGRPKAAKVAVGVVLVVGLIEGLLQSTTLLAIRGVWGDLFTNEEEVVDYIASIMPILVVSNFMDCIQGVLSGIARGCGWQKIGAYVNLGAYYLVGLPLAITLTFAFHFGGKGLWIGIIGGSSLQALMLLVITTSTNWEHQAKMARDRVYTSSIPLRVFIAEIGR